MNSIQNHAESMVLKMDPDLAIPQIKAMLDWTTHGNTGETSVRCSLATALGRQGDREGVSKQLNLVRQLAKRYAEA